MRKAIPFGAFLLCYATSAYCEVIRCTFTEPFLSTRYNTSTLTFEVRNEDDKVTSSVNNVSFEKRAGARFVLLAPDKSTIQSLNLNQQGSDGMSDKIYPYEVTWTWHGSELVGGCSSDTLSPREVDDDDVGSSS